jgi:predicted dehydrogenase
MAKLQAAIAGLGFMGRTHLQALRRLGIEVSGIIGISAEEGQKFAHDYHLEHVYRDFDELIADKQVNVVHICTPNQLHYPMAKAAIMAGKHVICEKPLATNSHETGELVELAKAKGLTAVVNYNLRLYPLCQEARTRLQSGEMGQVYLVHGGYLQDWLFLPTDWNWRLDSEAGSSRVVADIGTHWLDMITWLTGHEVVEVMADMATVIPTRYKPMHEMETFSSKLVKAEDTQPVNIHSEDCAVILLRLDNGARGAVTLSQVSAGRKNYFWWEVSGSKASLRWQQEDPNALWIGHRDRPNEVLVKDPALMHPQARPAAGYPGGHAEGYPDTFVQMFKGVYEPLAAGSSIDTNLIPTFADGHRGMLFCEAILRSNRDRCWVKVEK